MSYNKLFQLINDGKFPFTKEHFTNIQIKVLEMLRDELIEMVKYANKGDGKSIKTNVLPNVINQCLTEGKTYEGTIVSYSNQYGTFLNIKCSQYGKYLQRTNKSVDVHEGDDVYFTAIKVVDKKDSSKVFWKADNVRLKK